MAVLLGLAMFWFGTESGRSAETASLKEHELKAAFLYKFTKFIEWPTNTFRDTNAPFVVAVAGNSPCKAELEQIAKERKVNGRDLIIKTIKTPEGLKGAHVLFVSAGEDTRLKDWLAASRAAGILTIGESESFAREGGIINFSIEGERIRFDLNITEAEAAGLKISAQMQKLAKTVRKKP